MDMLQWTKFNEKTLSQFKLLGTSGTARAIMANSGLNVEGLGHGPDGGDVYIAHAILERKIDKLIFFIDVKEPHGHEHDIQMLIRNAVLANIPFALNRKTADFLITSDLL